MCLSLGYDKYLGKNEIFQDVSLKRSCIKAKVFEKKYSDVAISYRPESG